MAAQIFAVNVLVVVVIDSITALGLGGSAGGVNWLCTLIIAVIIASAIAW